MRLLCVSDTHGQTSVLEKVVEQEKFDILLHSGDFIIDMKPFVEQDFKIFKVKGNCDSEFSGELQKLIEVAGRKILLVHGHQYQIKYQGLGNLSYRARELGVQIVIFGHTHQSLKLEQNGILYFNPGSLTYPRDGIPSYGVLEVKKEGVKAEIKSFPDYNS